jgi:dihydropteroate synthase
MLKLEKPVIMGIINATPDSFFEGSRYTAVDDILFRAEKMMEDGVTIIDIGAQSTRPGSVQVGAEEELERLVPAIEVMHARFPEAIISADTFYARVAAEAVAAGAGIINDIGGGTLDAGMISTVARLGVPYICMHIKGTPDTMQQHASYENVTREVLDYFILKSEECTRAGIHDMIIDPGFGFAKTIRHNFQLLRELPVFSMLEKPLLVGISRKSTIYKTLGVSAAEAMNGSTVLHTIGLLNGAHILRVHDVKEAVEAVKLVEAYRH